MVKLQLRDVLDNNFKLALNKLSEAEIPAMAAWNIAQIIKKTREQSLLFQKVRLDTIKKYAELNEKGQPVIDENGQIQFKSDQGKESVTNELEPILDQEIEVPQLKMSMLSDVKVEARVLVLLAKIITE